MNVISFPGLGLEFNVSKIAFQIGEIVVYKYALCIVLGIIVAYCLSKISKVRFGIDDDFELEFLLGAIIVGILGARFYYVLFNLSHYLEEPLKIFKIRDGGLAIYGGILSAIIFALVFCKIKKKSFLDLADFMACFLALGQSIGRWGNFFNREAYGSKTTFFLRMGIFTPEKSYIEVHPVFLYESICTFLIFVILKIMQKNRKFKGQIFYMYFILYGFVRMFLEGLRTDSLWLGPLRISQILSAIFFVVFLIIYIVSRKKNKEE